MQKSAGALKEATDALRHDTKSVLATIPDITKETGQAILAKVQAHVHGIDELQKVKL